MVTSRTRAEGAASIAADTEVFRYVRHADVPRFAAEGWQDPLLMQGKCREGGQDNC